MDKLFSDRHDEIVEQYKRPIHTLQRRGNNIYCYFSTLFLSMKNQNRESLINPYWCISFGCMILSLVKLDYNNKDINFYIFFVGQICAFVFCIFIFIKKKVNSLESKEKYIKEWNEIKVIEYNDR